jgi:hypothetical protein
MKQSLLLLLTACCTNLYGQGSRSSIPTIQSKTMQFKPAAVAPASPAVVTPVDTVRFVTTKLPTFGFIGIANTNTESFNNINSSGKLSGYIRPWKRDNNDKQYKKNHLGQYFEVDYSYNINASNTDSFLANTFLFPDVGSSSYSGNVNYNLVFGQNYDYYIVAPFAELALKNIKGRTEDSTRTFYTINTTFGINFQYLFMTSDDKVSLGCSPYLSWIDVPGNNKKDYRYLFTGDENSTLKTMISSWGVKTTLQYNLFQIFADFRTVMGSSKDIPVDGLKGFHANLGIVFNAQIFEK